MDGGLEVRGERREKEGGFFQSNHDHENNHNSFDRNKNFDRIVKGIK